MRLLCERGQSPRPVCLLEILRVICACMAQTSKRLASTPVHPSSTRGLDCTMPVTANDIFEDGDPLELQITTPVSAPLAFRQVHLMQYSSEDHTPHPSHDDTIRIAIIVSSIIIGCAFVVVIAHWYRKRHSHITTQTAALN
jgi:hypothetical protein